MFYHLFLCLFSNFMFSNVFFNIVLCFLLFSYVEEKLCDWFDLVAPPVLWLLSGSALPGHLPLQDGTSNRAKGKRRKNSHHCTWRRVLCISCCVIIFFCNDVTSNRAKEAGWGKLRTNLVLEFISVLQSCRETSKAWGHCIIQNNTF